MSTAPDIGTSSMDERREYIKKRFPCISNCEMCGLCTIFHGKDAETVYNAYIKGEQTFEEVSRKIRG